MKDSRISLIFAGIVAVIWGLNFVFLRPALNHFSPFMVLTLRFAITSIILIPKYPKPPIKIASIFFISFVFCILHLGCMFWALHLGIESSVGSIIQQLGVPFTLLMAIIFFKEKINKKYLFSIFIAILGTVFIKGSPNGIEHPLAFLIMIGSAFFWAIYNIKIKQLENINGLSVIAWTSLFSIPMIFPLSLIFENNQLHNILTIDLKSILSLLYISIISSILAYGIWFYLLRFHPIRRIAPMILLIPVSGTLGGKFFLGEAISLEMVFGMGLIAIGTATALNMNRVEENIKDTLTKREKIGKTQT